MRQFPACVPDNQVFEAAHTFAASSKNATTLTAKTPAISDAEESDMWFLADARVFLELRVVAHIGVFDSEAVVPHPGLTHARLASLR